jgi:hypothetical protein
MSSVIRTTAQIANRVKYLIAVQATNHFVPIEGATINSIMTISNFESSVNSQEAPDAQGTLYKDLGSEVVTVDSMNRQFARYRLVQLVNGFTTEGVPNNYGSTTFYIQVWSAAEGFVTVARLG